MNTPTRRFVAISLVTLAACATPQAFADPAASPAQEDPGARTAAFVGTWEGPATGVIDGKTMQPHLTMQCARAGASPAVFCSAKFTGVKDFDLEEHELFAYDRASDTFHVFTANNFGEAYDHAATWSDPRAVTFVYATTRKGRAFREEYRYEWTSPTELRVSGTDTLDGQVTAQATGTLRKTS